MRFLLLFIAIVISAAIGFLNYLFLSGQLTAVSYALISMAISIAMTFITFHFIYLYYTKSRENRRQSKAFNQKEKEWEENKHYLNSSTQTTIPILSTDQSSTEAP